MSKQDNLKDYLTDLYEGIASRNPGASRNPQNFRAEIENIEGGGDAPIYDGMIEIDGQPADDYTDYYAKGVEDGEAIGKQAQYDEFWDKYQNYGKRTDYQYGAFGGIGWTDETYKPKYPMKPTYAYAMFFGCRMTEILGVDFSLVPDINNVFYVCNEVTHIGEVNAPLATRAVNTFGYCNKLHTIDKLVISESFTFSATFDYCGSLENLIIEGTIGQGGLNLRWSTKLSKASITSIINALSSTTSGLAVTLSRTAVNAAFETESGAADGSKSDEWLNLVASKTNWTITL